MGKESGVRPSLPLHLLSEKRMQKGDKLTPWNLFVPNVFSLECIGRQPPAPQREDEKSSSTHDQLVFKMMQAHER